MSIQVCDASTGNERARGQTQERVQADRTKKTKSNDDGKCGQMGARMRQQAAGKGESDN